ncbi:MAG: hypothetical protein EHM50_09015 [Lysobacterales bacterium]|nr:MAG: hypothetical protein EHM50_09015 [Xanthomonadales bacterium]
MKHTTFAAALLAAFLAIPSISLAQRHDIEHLVVEMANTAQEHQAVAEHYRMKAQEARSEAERHEAMGRLYATRRSSTPQRGRAHCENLAKQFEAIAGEYDELAKLHDDMSKDPQ